MCDDEDVKVLKVVCADFLPIGTPAANLGMTEPTAMRSAKKTMPTGFTPNCSTMLSCDDSSAATPVAKPHMANRPFTRCTQATIVTMTS